MRLEFGLLTSVKLLVQVISHHESLDGWTRSST